MNKVLCLVCGIFLLTGVVHPVTGKHVMSARDFKFEHFRNGRIIHAEKVFDESSGRFKVETDVNGISSMEDLDKLARKEREYHKKHYGAINGKLRKKFDGMDDHSECSVVITPKMPFVDHPDKTKHSEDVLRRHSIALAKMMPVVDPAEIAARYSLRSARIGKKRLIASGGKSHLNQLRFDDDIASIDIFEERKPCDNIDFSTLATSAWNPGPVPANIASGINAATFENFGIPQSFVTCKNLASWRIDIDNEAPGHASRCLLCLINTARGANIWQRVSSSFDGAEDQLFITNNNIHSVSMSMTGMTDGPNTGEFRVMDDFAYRSPYPSFCNPAGNDGLDEEVEWQCYNALSIGNARHYDLDYYTVAHHYTKARNPDHINSGCLGGSDPCVGDREMPHIIVPGRFPLSTGGLYTDNCLPSWNASGTSYSAAIANGISAALRSSSVTMNNWPELVRIAMMVTAQDVDDEYWNTGVDGEDGAGVVCGKDALAWATSAYQLPPNMSYGFSEAYYAGTWYSSETASKTFKVTNPSDLPEGKHLRIVLTWDSRPDLSAGTNELSDLDISSFYSESRYYYSSSWDSNVEMIDVPREELLANKTYSFSVYPYALRLPSGTSYFYWAVGWAWVKDHAY